MVATTLGSFERVESLDIVRVRASDLRVYAVPTTAGRGGQAPTTVGQARDALIANGTPPYALLDGAMFATCDSSARRRGESEMSYYARVNCERVGFRTYDRNTGVDLRSTEENENRGSVIAVVNGRLVASGGSAVPAGASFAVHGYPTIVQGGQNVASASLNRDIVWRAGLAIIDEQWAAFAVGRMSMHDFGARLDRIGAMHCIYSDGGGSARLMNAGGSWKGSGENRRVPTVWYAVNAGGAIDVRDLNRGGGSGGQSVPDGPPPMPPSRGGSGVAGAVIGGVVGFVLGGPAGAALGAAGGAYIGSGGLMR